MTEIQFIKGPCASSKPIKCTAAGAFWSLLSEVQLSGHVFIHFDGQFVAILYLIIILTFYIPLNIAGKYRHFHTLLVSGYHQLN